MGEVHRGVAETALDFFVGRKVRRYGRLAVAAAVAAASTSLALGRGFELSGEASFDEARANATNEELAFDDSHPLQIASAYFASELDVRKAKGQVNLALPFGKKASYGYEVNKQLDAVGVIDFELPITEDAIKKELNPKTGKTDITADLNEGTVKGYYLSSDIRDYTMDGSKQNFDDQQGGRKQIVNYFSGVGALFNIDTLKNILDNTDKQINRDMTITALNAMVETCPPELEDEIEQAVEDALRVNVALNPNPQGELGEVTVIPAKQWQLAKLPDEVKSVMDKKFSVDRAVIPKSIVLNSTKCTTTKPGEQNG